MWRGWPDEAGSHVLSVHDEVANEDG